MRTPSGESTDMMPINRLAFPVGSSWVRVSIDNASAAAVERR
jgi:hypothetical protein